MPASRVGWLGERGEARQVPGPRHPEERLSARVSARFSGCLPVSCCRIDALPAWVPANNLMAALGRTPGDAPYPGLTIKLFNRAVMPGKPASSFVAAWAEAAVAEVYSRLTPSTVTALFNICWLFCA
jgi:hypothetical protein